MLTHVQNCSSTYIVCFVHVSIKYSWYSRLVRGETREIAEGEWPVLHLHTQRMKVCYVFMPTSFAFCVLVYLPLHAQFASDEERGGWGSQKEGEREPFGAAINVAAKWQCHARLGPLWRSPTAKEPNEDFRLKGCVPYSGREQPAVATRRTGLLRRGELRWG